MSEQHKKPVLHGTVSTKKKSELQKFVEAYMPDVASGILLEVKSAIVNSTLRGVSDFVNAILSGINTKVNRQLFGDNAGAPAINASPVIRYGQIFDSVNGRSQPMLAPVAKQDAFHLEKLIFSSREDAVTVARDLKSYLAQYKTVSVAYLLETVGLDFDHVATSYGWANLDGMQIQMVSGGYLLKLPRPMPLDRIY